MIHIVWLVFLLVIAKIVLDGIIYYNNAKEEKFTTLSRINFNINFYFQLSDDFSEVKIEIVDEKINYDENKSSDLDVPTLELLNGTHSAVSNSKKR